MSLVERTAEVLDVGIWTLGIVLPVAVVGWKYETAGLEAAVSAFVLLAIVTLVLGVTGSRATASVANAVERREGDS